MLKQFDLSQCPLGENLLAEDICNLLDGNALSRLVVCCGAKVAISCKFDICLDCAGEGQDWQDKA
jgi:hypothetical protein